MKQKQNKRDNEEVCIHKTLPILATADKGFPEEVGQFVE